jgi:ankyrin repeat protein
MVSRIAVIGIQVTVCCIVALSLAVAAYGMGTKRQSSTPPLIMAAKNGNLNEVKAMVAAGADVNVVEGSGYTPLSATDNRDVAEFLIAHGATINTTNSPNGLSPLHWAVMGDHKEVAKLLMDKGADVNARSREGRPLSMAKSVEVAEMLLAKGAALNVASNERPALHVAAYNGNVELAKVLLAHGADPSAKNSWGATPLHEAARSEVPSAAMATLLITKGAKVSATDDNGNTPLHTAVSGFTGCMDSMVPFWTKNKIMKDRLAVAEVLLANGANINATNGAGRTPLAKATEEKNTAAKAFLAGRGAK